MPLGCITFIDRLVPMKFDHLETQGTNGLRNLKNVTDQIST